MYTKNNPTRMKPGTIPPAKSLPMDTLATIPKTISEILGGIRSPRAPPANMGPMAMLLW